MPTEEDVKDKVADDDAGIPAEGEGETGEPSEELAKSDEDKADEPAATSSVDESAQDHDGDDAADGVVVPTQLGVRRYVYAAYFAGGIAIAFLLSQFANLAWTRLALYKPEFGEPNQEIVMTVSALLGTAVAVYYYRDPKTRTLVDEIASELSKVTWPDRPTVMNSTVVVIITTLVATTFFALMDRFWGFVTNLVYGAA